MIRSCAKFLKKFKKKGPKKQIFGSDLKYLSSPVLVSFSLVKTSIARAVNPVISVRRFLGTRLNLQSAHTVTMGPLSH
jgi:hypothetical protein